MTITDLIRELNSNFGKNVIIDKFLISKYNNYSDKVEFRVRTPREQSIFNK